MLRTPLLPAALSVAVFAAAAGCALAPIGSGRGSVPEPPRVGRVDEAFLPVHGALYERSFPRGELFRIPDDPRSSRLVERAEMLEKQGQHGSAADAYAVAWRRAVDGPAAPYILFKRCVLVDDAEESVAGLKDLIGRYPSFPLADAVRLELAGRLSLMGRHDEGVSVLNGIVGGPFAPYAAALSGELYYKLGRYDESLSSYERARKILAGESPEGDAPSGEHVSGETQSVDTRSYDGIPPPGESAGLFLVRWYLGVSKTLIAGGGETGRKDARELLMRIAGTPSRPYYQEEALALLDAVRGPAGEPDASPMADERLFAGVPRIGPGGNLRFGEGSPEGGPSRKTGGEAKGSYAVQIGSFGIRENAENVLKEAEGKGFSGFLSKAVVEGRTFFRVNVGPFADLPAAEGAKRRLAELGYSGFVVRER